MGIEFISIFFNILLVVNTTLGYTKVKKYKLTQKGAVEMTVNYKGEIITLTQEPYIAGESNKTPHYEAMGKDEKGREHKVYWAVKENYEEIEDESEMCDWNTPSEVYSFQYGYIF